MREPATFTTTVLGCRVNPDVVRHTCTGPDQTQIYLNAQTKLHLDGSPTEWRLLAKVIEDAAMEAERAAHDAEGGFVDLPGLAS